MHADLGNPFHRVAQSLLVVHAAESQPPRLANGRLERAPGPVRDDMPVVDDDDTVRDLVSLLQVVRREDDGSPLLAELSDHAPERASSLDIHRRGRLVQEDELGVPGDGHGETDTLCLSTREVVGLTAQQGTDPGALDCSSKGAGLR